MRVTQLPEVTLRSLVNSDTQREAVCGTKQLMLRLTSSHWLQQAGKTSSSALGTFGIQYSPLAPM